VVVADQGQEKGEDEGDKSQAEIDWSKTKGKLSTLTVGKHGPFDFSRRMKKKSEREEQAHNALVTWETNGVNVFHEVKNVV